MSDDETEDDDLDIVKVVERDVAKQGPDTSFKSDVEVTQTEGSDDSDFEWSADDGKNAYEKFKNRKKEKRKRTAASNKKARAAAQNGDPKSRANKRAKLDLDPSEKAGDEPLPEYVRLRRDSFDKARQDLKALGLKLPPQYDEVEFSDGEDSEKLEKKPSFPEGKPSSPYEDVAMPYSLGVIPAPIAQWLRGYQVDGVSFLHESFVHQRGAILGDDMGLGKTIQVIAFLTAAFGKTGDIRDAKRMRKMRRREDASWYPRVLVVCPGSLIENWKAEIERWGWWQVDVFHAGTKESALEAAKSGWCEIMITTYATYRLNKSAINVIDWDCVIADECHIIKETTSEITQAMNEINALCRIGLTGTALQNKYEEMWTLLNWTNPGHFGPLAVWKSSISEPLRIGQSHDATVPQLSKARKTAKMLVENLLPRFFLRRTKALIADQLPRKSDRVVFCPLTNTQREAYERFLDSESLEYVKYSSEDCDCGSGKKRGWCCYSILPNGTPWQHFVFPSIVYLQKLSNHLALLIPQGQDNNERQSKDLDALQTVVPNQWKQLYQSRDSIVNYANPDFCGKWKVLRKLLKFWHGNGDKVLIFSHSVRLLKMFLLLFSHTSYNVSFLDGSMSYEERFRAVNEFNSDPNQFVFLISSRAGGVGLNIASANKVVIADPNWNPSHDLQAQDRAYRIGQVRDVEVFRLVSVGTIEEIVYARQIYKQQQANIGYNASRERRYFKGVQEKSDQKGEIFGLQNLFGYQGDNVVLKDIVNKTNVAESRAGVDIVGLDIGASQEDSEDDPLGNSSDGGGDGGRDEDSQDRAMSQLAALVKKEGKSKKKKKKLPPAGKAKRTDAVNAILARAGVDYTHENAEVIGSSKVESRLSKRAEATDNDAGKISELVFNSSGENSEDEGAPDFPTIDGKTRVDYKYRPPPDVQKRQFCTMAKTFGFNDATEFALVVEGWTQAQRRTCLERFYRLRREKIAGDSKSKEQEEQKAQEESGQDVPKDLEDLEDLEEQEEQELTNDSDETQSED